MVSGKSRRDPTGDGKSRQFLVDSVIDGANRGNHLSATVVASGLQYRYEESEGETESVFDVTLAGYEILIRLNGLHPLFAGNEAVIQALVGGHTGPAALDVLDRLLKAWAHHEVTQPEVQLDSTIETRRRWGQHVHMLDG